MSVTEDKRNTIEKEMDLNEDFVNKNTVSKFESGSQDVPSTISSETIEATSKIIPLTPGNFPEDDTDKESGDTKVEKTTVNKSKTETTIREPILDFGKGSGDHTAISNIIDKEISLVVKTNEITHLDVSADTIDLDEMELKWDDNDDDDDNKSAIDDVLLEEQLLQDDTCELSKIDVKNNELIDESILEETNTNPDHSENKSELDVINDDLEIDSINTPVWETKGSKQTFNIDTPIQETVETEEIVQLDRGKNLVSEDALSKIEEVTPQPSYAREKLVPAVETSLENTNIDSTPGNPGNEKDTDIDNDDDLNVDSENLLLEKAVDSQMAIKIPDPEIDVTMDNIDDKINIHDNHPIQKTVDSPVTIKILDHMDITLDNLDHAKEDKLLKGNENEAMDDSQDKIGDKLLKDNDDQDILSGEHLLKEHENPVKGLDKMGDEYIKDVENKVINEVDEESIGEQLPEEDVNQFTNEDSRDNSVKIVEKNLDDENQVVGNDEPSVDHQNKINEEVLKDDKNQPIHDNDQDKIGLEVIKDEENQVINEDIQEKIVNELFKDDENQVMDIGDVAVDDQEKMRDIVGQITTDINEPISTVDGQSKILDDSHQIPADLHEEVREKQNETPGRCLDSVLSDKPENISLVKIEKEMGSESEPIENILKDTISDDVDNSAIIKTDSKSVENVQELTEETKIDVKSEESTKITSMSSDDIPAEENIDVPETNKTLDEESDINKIAIERDGKSNIISYSLHKPDVMLEIPSQELIDIDAELSINLDQLEPASSEIIDKSDNSKEMADENIKDMVKNLDSKEREVKDTVALDDKDKEIKDVVVQETVEEGMERMFAENPVVNEMECIATTSKPGQSTEHMQTDSNDLPEMTDSLGLLAESVRVRDDEGDDDNDDDFDNYESSNQVSPEQSDDSNAPHSEDAVTVQHEKDINSPDIKENEFQFMISNVESTSDEKETEGETVAEAEENDQDQQMYIETMKLIDASDNEKDPTDKLTQSEMKERDEKTPEREIKPSSPKWVPSHSSLCKHASSSMKKLEIKTMQPNQIVNIVDLQESSEDETQQNETEDIPVSLPPSPDNTVTTVNIPSSIEVMASGGTTSEMVSKRGEIVVSGVPKPKPHPPARLNTSEVTIKTVSHSEPMVIPETKITQLPPETQVKPKLGLEIFSLDSDEEDNVAKELTQSPVEPEVPAKRQKVIKCMNYSCASGRNVLFILADARITAFYETGRKKRTMVCQECANAVYSRAQNLIEGIKSFTPLVDLQMGNQSHELVEISDSESEDDDEETEPEPVKESIGEKTSRFLEENLAGIFNDTWKKYDLETRLKETQIMLEDEMDQIERETKDLNKVFDDYQQITDTLRRELYATFKVQREELPALTIVDKPGLKFVGREPNNDEAMIRAEKRRKATVSDMPSKRPTIALGYAPLDDGTKDKPSSEIKLEEDKDISVVRLSMELAPADLPPPGMISRPPLRVGMPVYAMKNAFGPWLKGRILEIQPRAANNPTSFSLCRVKFDHKTKTNPKILPARCVAYAEPSDVRMTIGTRLIALFKDSTRREAYYSGVVAEIPNPVNSYRYLVFFDDGYAQYVHHPSTRLVCESSPLVWEEVHQFSREFVMEYLLKYPERPMVRLHEGQHLKTEWNGKWWPSRVSRVDASLAQVMFVGDGRREWIYRGSTRLAPLYLALRAAERHRPRPMPRSKAQPGSNMPYVEYTRSDEPETKKQTEIQTEQQTEEIRHQRAVAKKSTASYIPPPPQDLPKINDNAAQPKESKVVYYTPKNAVRPYKMTPHRCGPQCKRSDVLTLKELRTYNPLAKPLLSGWERQLVRFKGNKEVMYRAPCGRRLRNMGELHHYLRLIDSELPVDLFDFNPITHCLAEFVMHKCLVGKKDLSHGKENVPVPCVNFFDESLPEFCSYNTERTPTAGVPLNLDPEFLCGCDCTDDCADKEKCACWRMTLEGARTIGLEGPSVGYVYKRLPEPLPSGIYECNSRCKCKDTCLNRVAQHPLQLKLQVFKTEKRGWGIRALNDVPKGSFLCVYAGNLLTDATANLDGLNEGDEYLAELDYIEVVEQMKEGYEEDIPEADKKLDKKDQKQEDDDGEESESTSSEDDDTASKTDKEDDDFRPGYIGLGVTEFNKRLRRRSSKKVKEEPPGDKEATTENKEANAEEDCITISDDEEVREPSSFTVKAGMGANDFVSKYRSVRTYFGEDEACYIMDAKVQGNIGRYLNHSCCPNVFVQNVFVDTHDPRFPWVAFFALSHIKAGTELTWNYNYDVGSVPGKILYCFCEATNCRGRLL